MNELKDFFQAKRVFITGHTGFKGSWLSKLMLDLGAEVKGYSLPALEESHFNSLNISNNLIHQEGDIRDLNTLSKSILEFKPQIVFHLAAQAFVGLSYRDPISTYETNVLGSLNLLKSVNESESTRSLVYITSDKCYENLEFNRGYNETDRLGGHDPYSSSKACAEILFSSFSRSFFYSHKELGAASTRAGNVIGGGDFSEDRIVPDCIRAIREDKPIKLRSPKSTRPWQHVLEPISGYILLAKRLFDQPSIFSKSWNFGPKLNEERNVAYLAERIIEFYGKGEIDSKKYNSDFHEANLLQLDCTLAHEELKWRPRLSIDQSIKLTADWFRLVDEGQSPSIVTENQIKEYFKL
tara:strand:+ start:584 stop:1642 length:1059 start_codon:yes stop_codon:yes gene_type:complete